MQDKELKDVLEECVRDGVISLPEAIFWLLVEATCRALTKEAVKKTS